MLVSKLSIIVERNLTVLITKYYQLEYFFDKIVITFQHFLTVVKYLETLEFSIFQFVFPSWKEKFSVLLQMLDRPTTLLSIWQKLFPRLMEITAVCFYLLSAKCQLISILLPFPSFFRLRRLRENLNFISLSTERFC